MLTDIEKTNLRKGFEVEESGEFALHSYPKNETRSAILSYLNNPTEFNEKVLKLLASDWKYFFENGAEATKEMMCVRRTKEAEEFAQWEKNFEELQDAQLYDYLY